MRFTGIAVLLACFILLSTCTAVNRLTDHMHLWIGNNPTTLDPALIVDVNGGQIGAKLFNGLVKLGEDLQVVPDIAESWTVSWDGLVYRFTLRQGVRFSSGREVHAWDFKYSFERVLDPETKSSQTWVFDQILGARDFMEGKTDEVKGIKVVDERTLEIRLKEPFSPFLSLLTMPAAYVVPVEEVLHWGPDFSSNPVGTGPYVLRRWMQNRELVLEARQDYFGGSPGVRGIVYRIIPEELTAVAEFELGNLDMITVPSSEYMRYRKSPEWKGLLQSIRGLNTYYLGLNNQRPPFDRPELRRAMNLAIDRQKILATLFEGRGRPASGPVPDVLRRWDAPKGYRYDPVSARQTIKAEGLEGARVNFYINTDQQVVDIAEVIQSYLAKAGLDVRIKQLEWSAFKDAVNRGEPDMFWLSWWADYPDPENFLFPTFHSSNLGPAGNRARYENKEVDELIGKGQRAISESDRTRFYGKAEEIIVEDAPWVFFWHRTDFAIRQPWVKKFRLYPVYSMDKGMDVSL